MSEPHTDILIVGGGVGGCAAALAATARGARVVLTEPTAWLGGQLTSQAVPPDEHPWIETHGGTERYRQFRRGVRAYYQTHYPLTAAAANDPRFDPGRGSVSNLCHEPRVALAVIDQMLAPARTAGRLRVLLHHSPVAVDVEGDRVRGVTLVEAGTGRRSHITADFVLDATELGDLLPLAGAEYVTGAESRDDTGEPHAVAGPAEPDNVQALTWCVPLAFDPTPGADHVIDRPATYEHWARHTPDMDPPWTGPQLSPQSPHAITLRPRTFKFFGGDGDEPFSCLWEYRRIICADHYDPAHRPHEATMVNWPHNDYLEGSIIDQPPEVVAKHLDAARQLTLSLVHWLQTQAPRPDGGAGYPGFHLHPELVGTADGLAMAPYIRESRRIIAHQRVTENHVGYAARGGRPAELFDDSVGTGFYRIDLHPSTGGNNYIDIASLPFQIPLGSLLPARLKNLLAAGKNLGVTHITNGCYRLHPVEWNVGEAAGLLAAWCGQYNLEPHAVRDAPESLRSFQDALIEQGVCLAWPDAVVEEHLATLKATEVCCLAEYGTH